jgi:hypothetical protein
VSYFAAHNFKVFHPRYLAVSFPCVLLVFAAGFADLPSLARRLLGGAVVALWAVSLAQLAFVPEYGREDYRGALATVRAGWRPDEQVLAVGAQEPVEFYARSLRVRRWWLGHVARPARMDSTFEEALSRARGSWVVLSRAEDLDPGGAFARMLAARYPHAGTWSRPGVRVWHIVRSSGNTSPEAGRGDAALP